MRQVVLYLKSMPSLENFLQKSVVFLMFGLFLLPIGVWAKAPPGATRCLTKEMKLLHQRAITQMEKDVQQFGINNEAAVTLYRDKLTMIWGAMSEPYCGYGSRGLRAVRSSFSKSVNKTRAQFLSATKSAVPMAQEIKKQLTAKQ